MPRFFIIDKDTLEVALSYEADIRQEWGGDWGNSQRFTQVQLSEGMDHRVVSASRDAHNNIVLVPNEGKKQELMQQLWEDVRVKRATLLKDCDWTISNDSPLNPEKQMEWRAYRQALRDLPTKFSDPKAVVFPTPPQ